MGKRWVMTIMKYRNNYKTKDKINLNLAAFFAIL